MVGKKHADLERDPEFTRDRNRSRLFGRATGFVIGVFVIVLAVAVVVPIAPEYQKLREIEAELADIRGEEERVLRKRRQFELEAGALEKNLDYLESRARDVGPFYRPGEQVIKIDE